MEVRVRDTASAADVGRVVAKGVGDFEIIITEYQQSADGPYIIVYGVVNKTTNVIEAYTNSLSKAKYMAGEFDKDARLGYDRPSPPQSLAMLLGGGGDEPPTPTRLS